MVEEKGQKTKGLIFASNSPGIDQSLLQMSAGCSQTIRKESVKPAMQKKSLEALKARNLTADVIQEASEGNREFTNPFGAIPFLGIDPRIVGLSGHTGVVESLADRQMREHREKETAQARLINRIHDAIDAFLRDENFYANALLIHPADYRMLLCHTDAISMVSNQPREYRGMRVIQNFDMEMWEVRVGFVK